MASGGMLVTLSAWQPYVDYGDDRDACISQSVPLWLSVPCQIYLPLSKKDEKIILNKPLLY